MTERLVRETMADRRADGKVEVWERHGQTILLGVITATLIGTASILFASNATQAAMATEIRNLTTQVAEMRGTIGALQNQYVSRPEYNTLLARVQALEAHNVIDRLRGR